MPSHSLKVGDAEIIALNDMPFAVPYEIFFPSVSKEAVEAYREHYPGSWSNGLFATHCSAYVIRSLGQTILCDTGMGPGPIAFLNNARGVMLDDMREKGVDPAAVDIVVHTHLHGDHVGWNISAEGKPNFPNARFIAPQADWDYFQADLANQAQMQQVIPLQEMGLLDLVSGEVAINAEITTYPTPGHTPGHQSIMVSSAGERVLITGDLAHHPAQVDQTDWNSAFDIDGPTTARTRADMFAQLEADGIKVAFCHFPEAPFGQLVRLGTKRIWQALP
jgi:glyoxylase-like metal-dependent hydrolase (beta-lactamase superfamily II)